MVATDDMFGANHTTQCTSLIIYVCAQLSTSGNVNTLLYCASALSIAAKVTSELGHVK